MKLTEKAGKNEGLVSVQGSWVDFCLLLLGFGQGIQPSMTSVALFVLDRVLLGNPVSVLVFAQNTHYHLVLQASKSGFQKLVFLSPVAAVPKGSFVINLVP